MQNKTKNQSVIWSHFDVKKAFIKNRNDVENTSYYMKVDKYKKIERHEKMNVFDKKLENERSNKRQHKRITKVFNKNYW